MKNGIELHDTIGLYILFKLFHAVYIIVDWVWR